MICDNFLLSPSANGLYILYTIAVLNPNSANDNIDKMLEYNPFTLKYTLFKHFINTVLTINAVIIVKNL